MGIEQRDEEECLRVHHRAILGDRSFCAALAEGRAGANRAPLAPQLGQQRLVEGGATVKRYKKPTFTKPAPVDLRHEIATHCTLVIEALAD